MSVQDSGIGIPPDKIEHSFVESSQADETTIHDYGGTGLGLPISRGFCQMMGGDITAASVVAEGSTITIKLSPVIEEPAQLSSIEPAAIAPVSEGADAFW
jgi:signal transduction histidine kinase